MCKGERPIGAAKGKQTNTMASCQDPPVQTPIPHQWDEQLSLCLTLLVGCFRRLSCASPGMPRRMGNGFFPPGLCEFKNAS